MRLPILTALLFLCGANAVADLIDDVRCREIGFSKSAETRDLAAFSDFVDADARFVGGGVLRGTDAIVKAWTVFFQDSGPSIKWRPRFIEVLEDGKLALSRGPYRVRSVDENGLVVEEWGTFNSVWRLNTDGQWRIVFDAGNEAATEPDDATRALLDAEDECP